ncbi:hypothetical protein [Allosphingosinicella deserti]|uniref:hypothetical protein n=1 Tax=Allosphingosinicella deserti TaxID=2116704 RepID=UPI00130498DD|nr:hypothetical protein [Sphingomonas deserti]
MVNVLVGAIAGAAIGKFGVEARRRVRDAGFNMQLVGWVWLVLGLLELVSWLAFLESDPDWSQWLFLGLNFVVPLVAAVFLLAPSRRGDVGRVPDKPRFWRGPAFGAACILSGMAVAAALTAYANGVRDAIERRAQFEASRPESAR